MEDSDKQQLLLLSKLPLEAILVLHLVLLEPDSCLLHRLLSGSILSMTHVPCNLIHYSEPCPTFPNIYIHTCAHTLVPSLSR
jgi:hypothetical protein